MVPYGRAGVKAHVHEYAPDMRPLWAPGFICQVCGFRIPGSLEEAARAAGARFILQVGDVVWLRADEENPRERVRVVAVEPNGVLMVEADVHPADEDGLFEVTLDQVEV